MAIAFSSDDVECLENFRFGQLHALCTIGIYSDSVGQDLVPCKNQLDCLYEHRTTAERLN